MSTFLALTVVGLVTGCIYALTATGLVVTYTTAGVFNFAQGAMGMIAAFGFWQLWQGWGLPLLLALPLVVLVAAPLAGLLVERLFRRTQGAPADQTLAVTLGLLLVLIGIANAVWPPDEPRILPRFGGEGTVQVGILVLSASQLIVVATAVAVGVGLRLLFSRTRLGLAMRGVVDDPDLLAMNGLEPVRVQQTAWALSSTLAALAGVLLAPLVQLNILTLTLLVVNGYAAAMVGRLRSLPATAAGGLGLGLAISYSIGYGPSLGLAQYQGVLSTLQQGIPMMLLFVVLVLLPSDRLRAGRPQQSRAPRVPALGRSAVNAAAFVVAAGVLAVVLPTSALDTGARALVFGFVVLSLVLLTGYGGQVSLCTLTFVGLGAYAMGKVGSGSLLGVVAAVLLSASVGALVALPTLRLRGLYLALATFAFGQVMDIGFFGQRLGPSGSLKVERLALLGLPLDTAAGYFLLCAVVFALGAVGLLAVRRSRYGRMLAALNDSPAACATLGMRIDRVKLCVFAAASGAAGLGGALFGGLGAGLVSGFDFVTLQSCVLLLLLRVGGVKTVTGALLAGTLTAVLPVLQQQVPALGGLVFLVTGVAALSVGSLSGGLVGAGADLRSRYLPRRPPPPAPAPPAAAAVVPAQPVRKEMAGVR
ncbi:MAG: amino acid/amide transporter rane protein 2, family / amino acid/amide transporter [Frankiales bacterium]|nr:amino acid/amide transporter rane protein 2, family / amino acid/amide transporter [Frankiales bacterium]